MDPKPELNSHVPCMQLRSHPCTVLNSLYGIPLPYLCRFPGLRTRHSMYRTFSPTVVQSTGPIPGFSHCLRSARVVYITLYVQTGGLHIYGHIFNFYSRTRALTVVPRIEGLSVDGGWANFAKRSPRLPRLLSQHLQIMYQ